MNNTKKLTCLAMIVIICALSVITVSAIVAEGYGRLVGSTTQDGVFLEGNVNVLQNPDNAKLNMYFRVSYDSGTQLGESFSNSSTLQNSSRGVTSFSRDYLMYKYNDLAPRLAYTCYQVYSGGTYSATSYTGTITINQSAFN